MMDDAVTPAPDSRHKHTFVMWLWVYGMLFVSPGLVFGAPFLRDQFLSHEAHHAPVLWRAPQPWWLACLITYFVGLAAVYMILRLGELNAHGRRRR